MAQTQAPSSATLGIALLSVLCSVLSSALFSSLFSRSVENHSYQQQPQRFRDDVVAERGRRPSHIRFEAPSSASDIGTIGDYRHRRRMQDSGVIYVCAGRKGKAGKARFVASADDCRKNEDFFSWTVDGDSRAEDSGTGCSVVKDGDVATVACGESSTKIFDGADGSQGPPGAGCSVSKGGDGVVAVSCGGESVDIVLEGATGGDGTAGCTVARSEVTGVATVTCGDAAVSILDGEAGPPGEGCNVIKADGVATVACGDGTVTIADGVDGREGEAGADGAGCSVSKSNGVATVWCGATSAQVADGAKGPVGSGCSVSKTGNVAAIDCGGDVVEISDGEGAANGPTDGIARLDEVTMTYGQTFRSTEPAGTGKPVENMQPSLGVNFIVRYRLDDEAGTTIAAILPPRGRGLGEEESHGQASGERHVGRRLHAQDGFLGEIRMFAGEVAPEGWLLCDGSHFAARSSDYNPLYKVIGNTYDPEGIDIGYFAIPDLRGRVPLGAGQVQDAHATAQEVDLARQYGSFRVVLTIDNLPGHQHLLAEAQTVEGIASFEATT